MATKTHRRAHSRSALYAPSEDYQEHGWGDTFAALSEQYPTHYMGKFWLNPAPYLMRANDLVHKLGLAECPPKKILDLGCGVGYFAHYCMKQGHDVLGVDKPERPIEILTDVLGVPFRAYRIMANTPLPDFCQGYETVTIFGVNLKHPCGEWWSEQDYEYLVRNILDLLPLGGEMIWRPNLHPPNMFLLEPDWWSRFPVDTECTKPFQMRVRKNA